MTPTLSKAAFRPAPKRRLTLEDLDGRLTITVPEAGQLLNLSRGAAYRAAASGQIPTLTFGSRLVVPVPKLLELVGLTQPTTGGDNAA